MPNLESKSISDRLLVTTNPIIVNAVRKEDPAFWDKVRDEFKQAFPDSSPEQRVSLMTMSVVLQNCRELRPIYGATKGRLGYVACKLTREQAVTQCAWRRKSRACMRGSPVN